MDKNEEFYEGERDDLRRVLQNYADHMQQGTAMFEMVEKAISNNELGEMRTACIYLWRNSGINQTVAEIRT